MYLNYEYTELQNQPMIFQFIFQFIDFLISGNLGIWIVQNIRPTGVSCYESEKYIQYKYIYIQYIYNVYSIYSIRRIKKIFFYQIHLFFLVSVF